MDSLWKLFSHVLGQGTNSSPGNGCAQDLSAEEATLGALNDLLVHGLRWVVHNHSALLVINLGVDARIADEVDNPLLALILAQT